jgi:sugar/nucleoside kinase (ribokinase family)
VKDITGAGDAALAGWVAAYCYDLSEKDCLKAGHALAAEVIQTEGALASGINKENLLAAIEKYYPDEP